MVLKYLKMDTCDKLCIYKIEFNIRNQIATFNRMCSKELRFQQVILNHPQSIIQVKLEKAKFMDRTKVSSFQKDFAYGNIILVVC